MDNLRGRSEFAVVLEVCIRHLPDSLRGVDDLRPLNLHPLGSFTLTLQLRRSYSFAILLPRQAFKIPRQLSNHVVFLSNSQSFLQTLHNFGMHRFLHCAFSGGVSIELSVMISELLCRNPHLVVVPVHIITVKPEINNRLYQMLQEISKVLIIGNKKRYVAEVIVKVLGQVKKSTTLDKLDDIRTDHPIPLGVEADRLDHVAHVESNVIAGMRYRKISRTFIVDEFARKNAVVGISLVLKVRIYLRPVMLLEHLPTINFLSLGFCFQLCADIRKDIAVAGVEFKFFEASPVALGVPGHLQNES